MKYDFSFVIPCFNSENTIKTVVIEIQKVMASHHEKSFEIILADDYSKDNTWREITKLTKAHKNIKAIHFSKNFGQHSALMAGYRISTGEYVISLDDDLQTPALEVFSLVNKLEEGYDVVYAAYKNKQHSAFRNLGTKFNNLMCKKLLGKPANISITSFFIARRFIIKEVTKYDNPYAYIPGLILRATSNIGSTPVTHRARKNGESGYSLKKLIALWINGFTAFSVVPLRISSVAGCLVAVIGFLYGLYIIIRKLLFNNIAIQGYSSMMAILLFIGGVIMMSLGMIGEYIGRIYISMNKSPQYVIKETKNIKADDGEH